MTKKLIKYWALVMSLLFVSELIAGSLYAKTGYIQFRYLMLLEFSLLTIGCGYMVIVVILFLVKQVITTPNSYTESEKKQDTLLHPIGQTGMSGRVNFNKPKTTYKHQTDSSNEKYSKKPPR